MTSFVPFAISILTIGTQPAVAEKPGFQIVLSGALAEKLPKDSRLCFSSLNQKPIVHRISELPLNLPFRQYSLCTIDFGSPSQGQLFSVGLSPELFDQPRKINIKLDAPKPRIRPINFLRIEIHYAANITKRMQYIELPRWDSIRNKFAAPEKPVLTIATVPDQAVIQSRAMASGCMGSKWWGVLEPTKLKSGTNYRFFVIYDSPLPGEMSGQGPIERTRASSLTPHSGMEM